MINHTAERQGGRGIGASTSRPSTRGRLPPFDLGALDRRLRLLEATLVNSTNGDGWCPLRWDPFHYEPFFYEVVNILLLKELCGSSLDVWRCPSSY